MVSKTVGALLVKLSLTFLLAGITIGFIDGNTLGSIFGLALVVTTLNYLGGDLLVLPTLGKLITAFTDGVISVAAVYILDWLWAGLRASFPSIILFAALITAGEYLFHHYLLSSQEVAP